MNDRIPTERIAVHALLIPALGLISLWLGVASMVGPAGTTGGTAPLPLSAARREPQLQAATGGRLGSIRARAPYDRAGAASAAGLENAPASDNYVGIRVVYPKDGTHIDAASTFLIGSCPPGTMLTCNGVPVATNGPGYFAHVVRLSPGKNTFSLVRADAPDQTRWVTVVRDTEPRPLPPLPLKIAAGSQEPKEDMGLTAGDLLALCVRATPGGRVVASIGARRIALVSAARASRSINRGLDAAYGVSFQRRGRFPADLYCGFYRVAAGDRWQKAKPRFTLTKGKRSLSWIAPVTVSIVEQPRLAETVHDNTIVRLGPGKARTTPLAGGVRLLVDGWQGNSMRCQVSSGRHVWILKEDLLVTDARSMVPSSVVRTINVVGGPNAVRLIIPLTQRLPYQIEQQLKPNRLVLRIFGVTSDTDWITQSPPEINNELLDHVTWKQTSDQVYEVTAHLALDRQWGFSADYEDTNLILQIKAPPHLAAGGALSGLRICVDPGHGGDETGAIGPSGIRESEVNLAIALQLKEQLQREGATVIMTRSTEAEGPTLAQRVETAVKERCDLLLSVHNNALPDGRDPWAEHGTSSYWYHPQSIELAKTLKTALVKELGFPDFGTLYQNLALARPSQMPAVLVEVGFMINPDEFAQLIDPQVQKRAARALVNGIKTYLAADRRQEQ